MTAYAALDEEFGLARELIAARVRAGFTQAQLRAIGGSVPQDGRSIADETSSLRMVGWIPLIAHVWIWSHSSVPRNE
jgi:hypothetical protein